MLTKIVHTKTIRVRYIFLVFLLMCIVIFSYGQVQIGQDIDGEVVSDKSGWSISLSANGDYIAIGAVTNGGTASGAGHVRVYFWNGTVWIQRGVDIDGEAGSDASGYSVSLNDNGTVVAIGAPNNDGNGSNSGQIRVYAWNGSTWVQRGLDINGENAMDFFGRSVSLSNNGNTFAAGAPNNNGIGHVRVYDWNGSAWVQKGIDIDGEFAGDSFGTSISLKSNGNILAVGAPFNGSAAGHVRVYSWNGSSWIQRGTDIDGNAISNQLGRSVSLDDNGNKVAIGATDGNGDISSTNDYVKVFSWNGSSWQQEGSDILRESFSDNFGFKVCLSSDGNKLIVGAPFNDGNGNASGHARLYAWNGSSWLQIGADIDGEASFDQSGWSVSMGNNGMTVAVGARLNSGSGIQAGHVRVYSLLGVDVEEKDISDEIKLYPNPNFGKFFIETTKQIKVTIYNILGEKISIYTFTEGNHTINLANQPKSIYFVAVRQGNKTTTFKVDVN